VKPLEYYGGREQTYLKHFFLERYLERVAYNIGSFSSEFVYVDGFSGPWRSEDQSFEDTSFMIAIATLRRVRDGLKKINRTPSIRCVFVEKDPKAFRLLQQAIADVQDIQVTVLNAEFEQAIPDLLTAIGKAFSLVFIDPSGWTGFGLNQIAPILRHRGEVLVNFMFDYINRFLDVENPDMSFDDLFGGPGWESAVAAGARREDAIIEFYRQQMQTIGKFKYVTWTRIHKPTVDRAYFYLVYGTRHPKGLVEFRHVEQREIQEQELVRLDAKQAQRVGKTGQPELFVASEAVAGPPSFDEERRLNLETARGRLAKVLASGERVKYEDAQGSMLELPLVWESDVKAIVLDQQKRGAIDVLGLKPRERTPKPGHFLVRRGVGARG
jgi:three-Cys-motif partner protein